MNEQIQPRPDYTREETQTDYEMLKADRDQAYAEIDRLKKANADMSEQLETRGLTMERLDLSKYEGRTPGPWLTVPDDKAFVYALDVEGAVNRFSLNLQKGTGDCGRRIGDREIMANRDLIADPPVLLAGLREAYAEIDRLKARVAELEAERDTAVREVGKWAMLACQRLALLDEAVLLLDETQATLQRLLQERAIDDLDWSELEGYVTRAIALLNNGKGETMSKQERGCQCEACITSHPHSSDCAVHNEPALPRGACNCRQKPASPDKGEGE